jgi:hypothetical protein
MARALTSKEKAWYFDAIDGLGGTAVALNRATETVTYNSSIASDESHVKSADPEELAHAVDRPAQQQSLSISPDSAWP